MNNNNNENNNSSVVISFRLSFKNERDLLIYKSLDFLKKNKKTSTLKLILYNYFKNFFDKVVSQNPEFKKILEMDYQEYEEFRRKQQNAEMHIFVKTVKNTSAQKTQKTNEEERKILLIDDIIY